MSMLPSDLGCSSVPLEHLDYNFIQNCSDLKHLEEILEVLRSGKEGFYPHLIEFCEKHVEKLNPNCRFLRKEKPPATAACFSTEEWNDIKKELQQWEEDVRINEMKLNPSSVFCYVDNNPPVRCSNTVQESVRTEFGNQRKVPRSYREWDRIDVEKECAKIDENEKKVVIRPVTIKHKINNTDLTDQEKVSLACREKYKGNESFSIGDYEEAVLYYTRSLSLVPSVAAYNNRAQAHIKLQRWRAALNDCQNVLKLEPKNVKALLRRATAHKHLSLLQKSHDDLKTVLMIEPNNKTAQKLLTENTKTREENHPQKPKAGRKLLIQEIEDEDEEEEEKDENEETKSGVIITHKSLKSNSDQNQNSRSEDIIQRERKVNNKTDVLPPELISIEEPERDVTIQTEDTTTEEKFETLMMKGRDLMMKSCYEEAADNYTQCLQLKHQQSLIYTNRALCYIKLQRFIEAKQDCDSAIHLEPTNQNAFYRRALANKNLNDFMSCLSDLQQVLCLDEGDVEAKEMLEEITRLIEKKKRSEHHTRVTITEVDDSDEDQDGPDDNRSWISVNPCNIFEFGQCLNAACADGDLLACSKLLLAVQSERLPDYISTQLDGRVLNFIIRTLNVHLMDSHPDLVYRHLKHLHTTNRFSMVLMLLDSNDLKQLTEIFEKLSRVQTETFSKSDVEDLAKKYI